MSGSSCSGGGSVVSAEPFNFEDPRKVREFWDSIAALSEQGFLPSESEWESEHEIQFYAHEHNDHRSILFTTNQRDYVTIEIFVKDGYVYPKSRVMERALLSKKEAVSSIVRTNMKQVYDNAWYALAAIGDFVIYPKNCRYFCYLFFQTFGITYDPTGEGFVQTALTDPKFRACAVIAIAFFGLWLVTLQQQKKVQNQKKA